MTDTPMDAIFRENLEAVRAANRMLATTKKDALISFRRYDNVIATLREWEQQLIAVLAPDVSRPGQ